MSQRFERFTERARKVLTLAQEEARRLNHNYIGTEHLLLGLVREGEGVAGRVLLHLGVDLQRVRNTVEQIISRGNQPISGDIGLTPRSKKVIELAVDEARSLHHPYIGTEHILLGLVREGEGVAAGVLESLGASLPSIREKVLQILNQSNYAGQPQIDSPTSYLDSLSIDLTELARQSKLDPVVGRSAELERIIQVLTRRNRRNPLLIGERGVGKTALVEGLAQLIVAGNVPAALSYRRLVMVDLGAMFASAHRNKESFAEKLMQLVEEASRQQVILFLQDLDFILEAEESDKTLGARRLLNNALEKQIQVIAILGQEEYKRYVEPDAALKMRFSPIQVVEPSQEEAFEILAAAKKLYEDHHHLRYSDEALKAAVELSVRYLPDRRLPEKALDLLDEAGSRTRSHPARPSFRETFGILDALIKEKNEAIAAQRYDLAASLREQEEQVRSQINRLEKEAPPTQPETIVTAADITDIVSEMTGQEITITTEDTEAQE